MEGGFSFLISASIRPVERFSTATGTTWVNLGLGDAYWTNRLGRSAIVERERAIWRRAYRSGAQFLLPRKRWKKFELIVSEEVGYMPRADIRARFLFQVIADQAERAATVVTTNLPSSKWTMVFLNLRLWQTLLDPQHASRSNFFLRAEI